MTATEHSMYPAEKEAKELIAELCKLFYDQVCIINCCLTLRTLLRQRRVSPEQRGVCAGLGLRHWGRYFHPLWRG